MDHKFIDFCKAGNLNGIINLIDKNKINTHANNEEGFRWACERGHKHIVEYLINLYKNNPIYTKINIHSENEGGFKMACMFGHLHIVKYLINLYKMNPNYAKIDIHMLTESGFNWVYYKGHKHIVKYLISLGCCSNIYKHTMHL